MAEALPKRRVAAKRAPRRASASPTSREQAPLWSRIGRGSLYAAVAVLPWLFVPVSGPAPDAVRTAFAALAATLGLVALLAQTLESRRLSYPGTIASAAVAAVVAVTALSALLAPSIGLSVFGGLVTTDALAHVGIAALLFCAAAAFVTDRPSAERLLSSFLGGASLAMLAGVLAMFGLLPLAIVGSLSSLGFMSVLALGLVALLGGGRGRLAGIAAVLVSVLGVLTLVLVGYPELWAALALVSLLTAGIAFMRASSIRLPLTFAVLALALTLVGPYLPQLGVARGELRPGLASSLGVAGDTLSSRHAVLGTGPATYASSYAAARTPATNPGPFWDARFDQGFSYLLTLPSTVGLLGLLAWLLLGLASVLLAWRSMSTPVASVAGVVVVLTVAMAAFFPLSFASLAIGAIALGILVGWTGGRRSLSFAPPSSGILLGAFSLLILISAATLAGTYLVAQRLAAQAYAGSAFDAISYGDVDAAVASLARAVSLDSSSENLRSLSQAYLAKFQDLARGEDQDAGTQVQSALTLAVQAARAAVDANPRDARNLGNLGSIYEGMVPVSAGADQEALAAYDRASELEPSNPAWFLAKARVYRALAEFQARNQASTSEAYAAGQQALQQALDLKPDYVDALFVSAQLYLKEGRNDEADARVRQVTEAFPQDANAALQYGLLYYESNLIDRASELFARSVSLDPEYANARYFYGLALSRQGSDEAALVQFRWLRERNPENEEVARIIENLEQGRPVLDGIVVPTGPQPEEAAGDPVSAESL